MSKTTYVTQPFLPPLDEFIPYLEKIWENKRLTNNGPFHREFESALCDYLGVEHLSLFTSGTIAETDPMLCSECGVCVSVCPYSAPSFAEDGPFTGRAQINPVLCKGCGLCVASCRSGAIHLKGFDNDQIFAQIFALNKAV